MLIRAARVLDAAGRGGGPHEPGALLLENGLVRASGTPARLGEPAEARIVDLPASVVIPALVNAHCHLDLSHLGPLPVERGFAAWIDAVRRGRPTDGPSIAAAVSHGIELCRIGGTAAVGDIAGNASRVPMAQLARAGLAGVSYLELLGRGRAVAAALESVAIAAAAAPRGDLGVGVSPHAPYTCSLEVYRAALSLGLPVSTHLAETLEEEQMFLHGDGALAEYLGPSGLTAEVGAGGGLHPVDHLAGVLGGRPVLAAHLNYIEDRHLDLLAGAGTAVAYCPRASAYFGHPRAGRPAHCYRRMREAGITVALGTDGLPCLDTPDRISVLDDMRFLYRRDGTDFMALLEMATVAGAEALGLEPGPVTFAEGPTTGAIALRFDPADATDPLVQVLTRDDAPEWVFP